MDEKKLIAILTACSNRKGNRCSQCPAFGKGDHQCSRNAMRAAATCIDALTAQLAEKDKQLVDVETQHRVEYCENTGYDCEVRGQLAAAMEDLRGLCWCCTNGEKWEKAPAWSNMTTCEHIRERGSLAVGGGKAGKDCPHWKWRGLQDAAGPATSTPNWAAQFERRFMAGEAGG